MLHGHQHSHHLVQHLLHLVQPVGRLGLGRHQGAGGQGLLRGVRPHWQFWKTLLLMGGSVSSFLLSLLLFLLFSSLLSPFSIWKVYKGAVWLYTSPWFLKGAKADL